MTYLQQLFTFMSSEYVENLMATRSANWRLLKPLKRFLPHFLVVIYIFMAKTQPLIPGKIVARALLFKSGCQRKPSKMLKTSTEGGQQNKFILTS